MEDITMDSIGAMKEDGDEKDEVGPDPVDEEEAVEEETEE